MKGLLLVNLGTPDAPTEPKVRAYLREFLMDPDVIDIAWPLRWLLVNVVILRARPADSAALYRKVWTDRGSPLAVYHDELTREVATRLPDWAVEGAMRYGNPSIEAGIRNLLKKGATEIIAFPLYPQFSQAATGSSITEVTRVAARLAPGLPLRFVPEFYADDGFVAAFAERARETLANFKADHVLFSFHGLPERQVIRQARKANPNTPCALSNDPLTGTSTGCCDRITDANRGCYRAQCYETARRIATRAGIREFTVCFQSRLNEGWIRPFTDHLYRTFPGRGVKRLAVLSPAFVADCLETLEEIAIRGREEFLANGGEELKLVPSLNADSAWADVVVRLARS